MLQILPQAPTNPVSNFTRCLILALLLAAPLQVIAQSASDIEQQRAQAMKLYDQNRFADAMPIMEKLVRVLPSDTVLLERLGWSTFVVSASLKDPEARQKARARARDFLKMAKELGDDSELLRTGLDALSQPDDTLGPVSPVGAADAALREGEEAHSRGDLDAAIKGYKRALELDPKLYIAALFIGDMYFKKGYQAADLKVKQEMTVAAGEWFKRAIAIDENIETAYRYWGDALMAVDEQEQAKAKFIDGIIAEPFNRKPYTGLLQWAEKFGVSMSHPQIQQPNPSISSSSGEHQTTLLVDPKKMTEGTPDYYWSFYDLTRATYKTARFEKDHPGEKEYRHSLSEEAGALRMVAEIASRHRKEGKLKAPDPSLDNLLKLYDAELIEAYILFTRADEGIARDYAEYSRTNRDKLRRYWNDFVISRQGKF
jgi:tetratricopeptide (TPR) repeat protein